MIDTIVIGLGGNVGSEAAIIARFAAARDALEQLGAIRSAPLYRSAAIGPAQPAFLNTAVRLRLADAQPTELIATLHELERLLGRDRAREVRWGPRTIDLDLLVWGERRVRTPELELPHPRLAERKFALLPLIALLGEATVVPGVGSAGALLAGVGDQQVEQIAETWASP